MVRRGRHHGAQPRLRRRSTTEAGAVALTANLVGTVDPRGVFTVGGTGVFTRQFTLEQVDGEWRITDPPDGLIILRAGLRAALRRAATPTSSTRPASASSPIRAT